MPCYKINTAPSGYGKIGTTGYATEAECLEACKEGACCNGTTCSVKPQCQCVCETGSCCGPDTQTVNGVAYPVCRFRTKAECAAMGGVWRCGAGCESGDTPYSGLCTSLTGQAEPVFKGIGTTCTSSPCCRDASGASCLGLTPFPYPQSLYLKIANTGSVTLNRTFTLEFYPSASGSEGQYGIYSPNVRTGSTACSFTGFAGGCSQFQQNPVFSVYGYFSLSQGQWFGQLLYSDYYPGRQCGCDSFPLNISFSNDLCWLCDPSIVSDRSWTVLSYLTTHGEITQASGGGVATLSKNPLP